MVSKVLFSHKSDEWATPKALFDELNNEFDFTLDPCATDENHLCDKYYTIHDYGLKHDWKGERVFCNPPYSKMLILRDSLSAHTTLVPSSAKQAPVIKPE